MRGVIVRTSRSSSSVSSGPFLGLYPIDEYAREALPSDVLIHFRMESAASSFMFGRRDKMFFALLWSCILASDIRLILPDSSSTPKRYPSDCANGSVVSRVLTILK